MRKQHSPSAADEATKRQIKVADDALIASLRALYTKILVWRGGTMIDVDRTLEAMRAARAAELMGRDYCHEHTPAEHDES